MPRACLCLVVLRLVVLLVVVGLAGCVPYSVGTTAQPVPTGEWSRTTTAYAIPNGFDPFPQEDDVGSPEGDLETSSTFVGVDAEGRFGLDDASDLGVRVPGGSGVVVTYKRRIAGGLDGPALAIMGGGGLLNAANNAHLELTLIASGRDAAPIVPYGGLRAMQAFPLSEVAVADDPTLGGFGGVRIGREEPAISLEIGVFYDRSALDLRQSDVIFVPSVTLHGRGLGRLFPF
jgi:hypothetical protein